MPAPTKTIAALMATVALLGACSSETGSSTTRPATATPGADEPAAAVEELFVALTSGDYQRAAQLTVDDQMVAIAVTGNVPTEALQSVVESGGSDIGANYWRSFAENLEGFLGVTPDQVGIGSVTPLEVEGVEFASVAIAVPDNPERRTMMVQRSDGWKIDVVATFAPALAQRLGKAADGFRADPSASDVLSSLVRQRTSLDAWLRVSSPDPETAQVVRTAIVALGG